MESINVMEMFAGVGGFRVGLEKADSDFFKTVWANQYEPSKVQQDAFNCYREQFGDGEISNEDIAKVDEKTLADKDIGLIVGGFPCFAAGTLITTGQGYKKIEDIVAGDMVLTHKNRFRRVIVPMINKVKGIYTLKVQGSPKTLLTENHPVYVREKSRKWVQELRTYRPVFSEPKWVKAKDLKKGKHLIAMSANRKEENQHNITKEEAWLVGRYVADGYVQDSLRRGRKNSFNRKIIYSVEENKKQEFEKNVGNSFHVTWAKERRVYKGIITSNRLMNLCDKAGRGSAKKKVPDYILDLPKELLECFLNGYMSGDGFRCKKEEGRYGATTVSKELVYGLGQVVQKVYGAPYRIQYFKRPDKTVIEGSEVNQRDTWTISFYTEERKQAQGYYIEGMVYQPIRKLEWDTYYEEEVYNFEVEEDNSYTANNLTVKNCQSYSVARTSKQSDGIEGEKGVLFWDIVRMVREIKPKHLLLENVDRLLISPSKQRGRDYGIMLKVFDDLGYVVEWRVIDASHYKGSQRRVRVFIYAVRSDTAYAKEVLTDDVYATLFEKGFFAPKFPVRKSLFRLHPKPTVLPKDIVKLSDTFKHNFGNAGLVKDGKVYTIKTVPVREGFVPLRDILEAEVDESYYLTEEQIAKFKYLRGRKEIERETDDGYKYTYKEGAMSEVDELDKPGRTLLTGEGSVSRTTHIVDDGKGKRFLTPLECERLNNFPDNWTSNIDKRMRYFSMGNALDVNLIERMGERIKEIELVGR